MEQSEIACRRGNPQGRAGDALATVDDATDAIRAIACIRFVRPWWVCDRRHGHRDWMGAVVEVSGMSRTPIHDLGTNM
jgi:hypothetical protein